MLVTAIAIFAEQDLAEGRAKVRVEHGVNDGIQQTVEVSEPADYADQQRRIVASFGAERPHQGQYEERKPADDKRPGDDGERSRRFALSRLGSFQRLRPGRRWLLGAAGAEPRQLKVETRQIQSTAARRSRRDWFVHRQHAQPARTACHTSVLLVSHLHQP